MQNRCWNYAVSTNWFMSFIFVITSFLRQFEFFRCYEIIFPFCKLMLFWSHNRWKISWINHNGKVNPSQWKQELFFNNLRLCFTIIILKFIILYFTCYLFLVFFAVIFYYHFLSLFFFLLAIRRILNWKMCIKALGVRSWKKKKIITNAGDVNLALESIS